MKYLSSQNHSLNGGTTVLCEWISGGLAAKAIIKWIILYMNDPFWLYDSKLMSLLSLHGHQS